MYGPPDGKESIEEKRIRREREKREYESGLAEFDAKRNEEVIKCLKRVQFPTKSYLFEILKQNDKSKFRA